MRRKTYETDPQTMADLTAGKETVWKNPRYVPFDLVRGLCDLVVSEGTSPTPRRGWPASRPFWNKPSRRHRPTTA